MNLYYLIEGCSWNDLEKTIETSFPDQKQNLSHYEDVFYALCNTEPIVPSIINSELESLVIEKERIIDNWSVKRHFKFILGSLGYEEATCRDVYKQPWNVILGMHITCKVDDEYIHIEKLPKDEKNELIASILYEMTFCGFSETDIAKNIENMDGENPDDHV